MLDDKKVVIYGRNRYQRDFQYIFSDLKVAYFVDKTEKAEDCFPIEKLQTENFENLYVIICLAMEKQKKAILDLHRLGLKEKEHFCIMDDLFVNLDLNITDMMKSRYVVLWGTGNYGKKFMEEYREFYPELHIDAVMDNDPKRQGEDFFGYRITSMERLKNKDCLIIIAISEYRHRELYAELEKNNLNENCVFSEQILMEKPSKLLKKTIYDKNQFEISVCPKINDMRILSDGYLIPCGSAREIIVGNIFWDNLLDVWNSTYEKIYRLSILNRTHTFCKGKDCPYLVNRETLDKCFEYTDMKPEKPRLLLIETDSSCNIMCTSCRNHIFTVENDFFEAQTERIIGDYLKDCERIALSGNGEVFVSKYSKRILKSRQCIEKKEVSILSNGFAFNESNWKKYLEPYENVNVSISIDAATRETYEKLRRKSSWTILLKNLEFIQYLKNIGKIKYFQINFVVQKENICEVEEFVKLGKRYNVDRILMNKLENWCFTDEEYFENSVLDGQNHIKEPYRHFFENIKEDSIIDFTNLAQDLGRYPKDAFMY